VNAEPYSVYGVDVSQYMKSRNPLTSRKVWAARGQHDLADDGTLQCPYCGKFSMRPIEYKPPEVLEGDWPGDATDQKNYALFAECGNDQCPYLDAYRRRYRSTRVQTEILLGG